MAGDESSEQPEWKPEDLGEVLEVLGCFEAAQMPKELVDLDSIDVEDVLDEDFDDRVVQQREDEASLEMWDGSSLTCSILVVRRSAYLLDMSKVRCYRIWLLIKLHRFNLSFNSFSSGF